MIQEVLDEILSDVPKYTLRNSAGDVLNDDVDIALKTPLVQEGTPLNGAFFKNLQGDLYTDSKYNTLTLDDMTKQIDLSTVSKSTNSAVKNTVRAIAYGNGTYVAIASTNAIVSTDGSSWTSYAIGASENMHDVVFVNDMFITVTVTSGYVYTSTNGTSWRQAGRMGSTSLTYLYGLAYGNGIYAAIGTVEGGSAVMALTSTDLVTWEQTTLSNVTTVAAYRGIAFGNGIFVAAGGSGTTTHILTSTDGKNWTFSSSTNTGIAQRARFLNGMFLIGTSTGYILTSTSGSSWATRAQKTSEAIHEIVYDGSRYIATAEGGFRASSDGATWETILSKGLANFNPYDMVYDGSRLVILYYYSSSTSYTIIASNLQAGTTYFSLNIPLTSYEPDKKISIKGSTYNLGGTNYNLFAGANYLNINNQGYKPLKAILESGRYYDFVYSSGSWIKTNKAFASGTYSGNGSSGAANAIFLNCGFCPSLVIVISDSQTHRGFLFPKINKGWSVWNSTSSDGSLVVRGTPTGVAWYSTSSSEEYAQLNLSSTYYWIAFE